MSFQATKSLKRRDSDLADAKHQLRILSDSDIQPSFTNALREKGLDQLSADGIEVMQVNVGKLCNMTCRHCHVDAGPDRRELMDRPTIDACLQAIQTAGIKTLDLTGGAPEMNPHFEYFVQSAREMGVHVIDRCNLTILLANGFTHLPKFLAEQQVEIVASLPCYLEENADQQRGDGAFRQSIEALQRLNSLGYGLPGTDLTLTLVYNPTGPSLPPDQQKLESKFRDVLREKYDIRFTRLYTITNMPISRFLEELIANGQFDSYMQMLIDAFNPTAAEGVMCREMISVGWDGKLFDCDFNQMLELPTGPDQPKHIRGFDAKSLGERRIVTARHCFGCTAGAGSGCEGAII